MKKRLTATMLLVVLVSLLISNLVGAWLMHNQEMAAAEESLRELLVLMDSQSQITDPEAAAEQFQLAAPDKRLTIITPGGEVLIDTEQDAEELENHAGRPEVRMALSNGWGRDVRASDTVGVSMLYVAKEFTDGMVGRASMPLSSIDSLVMQSMVGFLVASAAAFLLAVLLSGRMSRYVLEPLSAVRKTLQGVLSGESSDGLEEYRADDELRPILRYIDKLLERLSDSIQRVTAERDKVNLVLDCMDEGLLLLDESGSLLTCNRAARKLLQLPLHSENNDELLILTRSRRLREAVEECHGKHCAVVLDLDDFNGEWCSLRLFLSPVSGREYEGEKVGTSILISDVTQLKKAERVRADFTANVSHELKTPLTSIKGFADMLSSGMVTNPEDQKRFSSLIGVEVDRLIALINDTLKLSELESVAIEQDDASTEVLTAAQEVAQLLEPTAKEAEVTLHVAGQPCQAAISNMRLKELLINLAGNGIKYNHPGGKVDILVESVENSVQITIRDTGIGIPEEAQDRVFERFYRVDAGRTRKAGGTGLGLAIVKHIVSLYGGAITLASAVGVGSTFTVTLPQSDDPC